MLIEERYSMSPYPRVESKLKKNSKLGTKLVVIQMQLATAKQQSDTLGKALDNVHDQIRSGMASLSSSPTP